MPAHTHFHDPRNSHVLASPPTARRIPRPMPTHHLPAAHLKLADMVSYVPLPVVGGYLGFVGYFCIAGGTALAAGVQVGWGCVAA